MDDDAPAVAGGGGDRRTADQKAHAVYDAVAGPGEMNLFVSGGVVEEVFETLDDDADALQGEVSS